jgi:hypothetical protein
MTRTFAAFFAAAAVSAAAVVAAQSPATTEQQRSTTARAGSDREMTITGCLMKGADGKYTLTNARVDNPASSTTAGTSGTSTTSGAAATSGSTATGPAATWALDDHKDLAEHVGQKVQVMGKVASSSSASTTTAPASPSASAPAATSGSTSSATANQRLDVNSVKMISSTCS